MHFVAYTFGNSLIFGSISADRFLTGELKTAVISLDNKESFTLEENENLNVNPKMTLL